MSKPRKNSPAFKAVVSYTRLIEEVYSSNENPIPTMRSFVIAARWDFRRKPRIFRGGLKVRSALIRSHHSAQKIQKTH